MAPSDEPRTLVGQKDKQLLGFLAFVQRLRHELPKVGDGHDPRNLTSELESHIQSIRSCSLRGTERCQELDEAGITLWNLCTHLKRARDSTTPAFCRLLVLSRVFALFIISLAHDPNRDEVHELIRIARVAIKAESDETRFALPALQKAFDYNAILQKQHERLSEDEAIICARLEAEYYILRTILSWKEDRLDVAESMYNKSTDLRQRLDSTSATDLTDALFEIGQSLLQRNDFTMAAKWLDRAYTFLGSQDLESLSREAIELQLAISQALIRAFVGMSTPDSIAKAESHVAYLESVMGDKVVVLLLRLEIMLKGPNEIFDGEAYANVLRRLIRSTVLSESTFSLIIKHVRMLDGRNPGLASQTLDDFLTTQVLPAQSDGWIERTVLLKVSMSRDRVHSVEDVDGLRSLFDSIASGMEKPLSATVARTILMIMWKCIESNFSSGKIELCESWCRLAAHPLLAQCGPVNAAKISRKLILCALERNDIEGAREVFQSMSENAQDEPMTWYLAHKLALRSGDQDMASGSIEALGASASKDLKYLYACCLDAQKSRDKLYLLQALKKLAEKFEFTKPGDVCFPALLRTMIRLQVAILDDKDRLDIDSNLMINDLCETFEAVVLLLQRDPRTQDGAKLFSVPELNWFSKNSYNLGVKHVNQWDLRYIISICSSALSITKHYPQDISSQERDDLGLRAIFCNFVISTAYIASARSEDCVEMRLQNYLSARKHIKSFNDGLEAQNSGMGEECRADLQSKLAALLTFDFEAAICLKAWDDLPAIARKSGPCKDLEALQVMGDLILRAKASPTQALYSTLRVLINETWQIERFDVDKLAKWHRCLLLAVISDTQLSLQLIEETCSRVSQAKTTDRPFPSQELVWFVTTSFNRGIDYYDKRDDELSKKWIGHAFSLVKNHVDGGVLEQQLKDHYNRLEWS